MTKSVTLRAGDIKAAEAIAFKLPDIFLRFEAFYILQSDNYRDFCNKDMKDLKTLWSELKTVHGQVQAQGGHTKCQTS